MGDEIEAKSRIILDIPPSCIAFSPLHIDHVIIGTYFLDQRAGKDEEGQQQRSGSLIVFKIVGHELIEQSQTPVSSAVLDIVFSPHDASLLYTATSTGSVLAHRFDPPSLSEVATYQVLPTAELVLDLVCHPTLPHVIGITTSVGAVKLVYLPPDDSPPLVVEIATCSLEAWTLAFSHCGSYVYHGSDDACLGFTALDAPASEEVLPTITTSQMPGKDSKSHGAGVTAILPLHSSATTHVLLTGSYDDHFRVLRLPRRRQDARVLAEEDLGGGVWRLTLLHATQAPGGLRTWVVLASCMHAGSRILQVTCEDWEQTLVGQDEGDGGWRLEVLARFEEHQSMNYGSDVQPSTNRTTRTIISSSFYDKLVCLWHVNVPYHEELTDKHD